MSRCRLSFFFSSSRRYTRCSRDWSSDVCSSDLAAYLGKLAVGGFLLALFETAIAKMRVFRVPEFLGAALMLGLLATLQIGRASCRERVYILRSAVGLDREPSA